MDHYSLGFYYNEHYFSHDPKSYSYHQMTIIVGTSNDNVEVLLMEVKNLQKNHLNLYETLLSAALFSAHKALQDKPQTDKIRNWLLEHQLKSPNFFLRV